LNALSRSVPDQWHNSTFTDEKMLTLVPSFLACAAGWQSRFASPQRELKDSYP
jgi:hypothetical protein